MTHSSEMRWTQAAQIIGTSAKVILDNLIEAEEIYQELNEIYAFAGGTDQLVADQLFAEEIQTRAVSPFEANAEEVAKVTDLKNAIQALHQLYQTLNNVAVVQVDRATLLRRMS